MLSMTMKLSNDGLRKAAILVASLDTAAADAVLDQLTPEQARQVREIVMEMDDIDQGEQRRVIDEFSRRARRSPCRDRSRWSWRATATGVARVPGRPPGDGARGRGGCPAPTPAARPPRPWLPSLPLPPGDRGREARPRARQRAAANDRPGALASLAGAGRGRAGAAAGERAGRRDPSAGRSGRDRSGNPSRGRRDPAVEALAAAKWVRRCTRRRVAGLQAVAGILQATDGRVGMQILDNLAEPRPRAGREARPAGAA